MSASMHPTSNVAHHNIVRVVLSFFIVSFVVSCTSPPTPSSISTIEEELRGESSSTAAVEREDAHGVLDLETAALVERLLGAEMFVPRRPAGPLLVDTGNIQLGIAQNASDLVVWRLEGEDLSVSPIDGEVELISFEPLVVELMLNAPQGFTARIRSNGVEDDLFVLDNGREYPYVVRTAAASTARTEVRDVDGDGVAEMIQYALIYEAPGRRELIVDLLEWENGAFVHRASIPLVRRLNQRLADFERALTSPTGDRHSLERMAAALTPLEGAPDPREMLPAEEALVPPFNELAVELDHFAWRFSHEIALMPGPAIYRIEIELIADPTLTAPARIIGLDD